MKLSLITATHYRVSQLANIALPSILAQTSHNFEWVIINDGFDLATRHFVAKIQANFDIIYTEIKHDSTGFSLCHARNKGLEMARGQVVAYLDDDNNLSPQFVSEALKFFQDHPQIKCTLQQQFRRRDIVRNGQTVRQGKPFISPASDTTAESLLGQRDIFDSNGFCHVLDDAPRWNPNYRIFADYEYFVQCLSRWGTEKFLLNPLILVNYTQTSEGIIGRSHYGEWAFELSQLFGQVEQYSVLQNLEMRTKLIQLISLYHEKHQKGQKILGFCEE